MTAAAISRLGIPTPDELVERARAMAPEIRELAEATEQNRNILPQIIDKIRQAELLLTCRPKEFGGFEHDGETALRIAMTISAACASTGWAVNGAVSNGRSLAHFPIEAQREVWGGKEDPFTCACFAPTGKAVPVDGGYTLTGRWSFASGCDHARWIYLGAFIASPDGEPPPDRGPRQAPDGAFFLLPIGDVEIIDTWFVNGLVGTGSKDIAAHEVFVAAHRMLRFSDARAGTTPGAKYYKNPLYKMPLLIHGASMLASTAVGAARGALDAYLKMTSGRETRGALAGGNMPMTGFATIQLRYAEAAANVDAAELILLTDMRDMTAKLYAGEEITVADRIRCRRDQAYVTRLAVQAVEALNASTGGYGLLLSKPVQRAWRDVNAVARHVSLNWDAVGTMYGQHAFGLEPKGQY
jgi:alkylation response protein AidB-like acyl-CoA dehydrogenase